MAQQVCRDPASAMLLWHVAGSLEGEEAERVEAHVAACPTCAREVDLLLAVDRAVEDEIAGPPAESETPERAPRRRRLRFVHGVAAGLGIAAVVAAGWALRQSGSGLSPGGPGPSTPGVAGRVVTLDLGGGPRRSEASEPVLRLEPGTEAAVLVFRVPADPGARRSLALQDEAGRVLAAEAEPGPLDVSGGMAWRVRATQLRPGGRHLLVVTDRTPDGTLRRYAYPFRVDTGSSD